MHSHEHHNHDHHHHAPKSFGTAFLVGIILNSAFIAAEVFYGLAANSMALLADAGHNASDVLGLFIAWMASILAKRKPTRKFTYGLQSSSIMAALTNAVLLLVSIGAIAWEAIHRFSNYAPVEGMTIIIVAAAGVFVNGITALLFASGSKGDLNIRGAYMHMAADAAISLGVVISGIVIMQTGMLWLDPAVSIVICVVIVIGTWGLFKDSINLALHAVPKNIDADKVHKFLSKLEGVTEVHDLHIWAMSTTEAALSAHLVMPGGHPGDAFLKNINSELHAHYNINHATIQIEICDTGADCNLASHAH